MIYDLTWICLRVLLPIALVFAIVFVGAGMIQNGGGFLNTNSAHPFENPTTWTKWLEIFLLLRISFSLPRAFGVMVGDRRQGRAIVTVMAVLAITSVVLITVFRTAHDGTVPTAVGASTEGTETRFGVPDSAAVRRRHNAYVHRCGEQLP